MPIRFRCVYCDRLLGISRRKAGAVVTCPGCNEQLIVPNPEDLAEMTERVDDDDELAPVPPPGPPSTEPPVNVFERSDFEDVLRPVVVPQPPPAPSPPAPIPPVRPRSQQQPAPISLGDPRHDSRETIPPASSDPMRPAPEGIVLSSWKATLLSILVVFLLAVAFVGGVLVDRFLLQSN